MASFTITIANNTEAADVRDSVCTNQGYSGAPGDAAAKMEFVRQLLLQTLKTIYVTQKANEAAETARAAAAITAKAISIT